jgi:RNA methyltransferase, TrmH family
MLSKREIKDIQSLSHKKFRAELKLFVAEGPKVVGELIQLVPAQVEKVYAVNGWISSNPALVQDLNVIEVNEKELEKISQLQSPNQVVAVFKQFSLKVPSSSFILYLDTIQDPGNFGTIIRIADWFGVKDVVCTQGCADLYNLKVVQSTMASIARVNVFYDDAQQWLREQNLPVYAATLNGRSLNDVEKIKAGILVIGNESRGISDEVLQYATEKITIPKIGEAESLNAAVATGIILSHLIS